MATLFGFFFAGFRKCSQNRRMRNFPALSHAAKKQTFPCALPTPKLCVLTLRQKSGKGDGLWQMAFPILQNRTTRPHRAGDAFFNQKKGPL
ncbi:MAG: hypothetical protein DBX55_04620 [Verrucomicrobia bacterium]|nr:MAG: hypothetical protein DBX55_04620 [Verrucomicrobiota bacterium]